MMRRIHEEFIAAVLVILFATMVAIPITRAVLILIDDHANAIAESR